MGYTPTEWLRRISQFPDRYTLVDLGGGLFTIMPSEGNVTQEGTPLSEAALNHLETQYDEAGTDLTAHKTNATPPGVHRWTAGKFLKGTGAGTDPTEVDVSTLADRSYSDLLQWANDAERSTSAAAYTKLKETKITSALDICRVKFDLRSQTAGYNCDARIYKNGVAIGTVRSTTSADWTTFSEDFSNFAVDDLVQVYARYDPTACYVYIRYFRFAYSHLMTHIGGYKLNSSLETLDDITHVNQDPA